MGNGGLTTNGHKQTFGDDGTTPSMCVDCCDYTRLSKFITLYHKSMNYISRDLTLKNWFKKQVLCYKRC